MVVGVQCFIEGVEAVGIFAVALPGAVPHFKASGGYVELVRHLLTTAPVAR